MFPLPYLLFFGLIGVAASFGIGWHYGGKGAAVELATTRAYADSLATQISATESDCKRAIDVLKANQDKRRKALQSAAEAAAKESAKQQATLDKLLVQATTATTSETNCAAAHDVLDRLALDLKP